MTRRPGRLEVRAGMRPHTAFGVDDRRVPVEHLTYASTDGHTWDALHAPPWRAGDRAGVLVLVVHGSMGNYISGVPRRATIELARAGFGALSVNTRMANFGVVYGSGLLDRTPADLDGALALARDLGYARVVLLGYGLGATVVTHHQALRRPGGVEAVATLAHAPSLPEALRTRWERSGATPGYGAVLEEAGRRFGPGGTGVDDIVVVRHGAGPTDAPADDEVWSLRAWWSSRSPGATHAISRERVPHLTVPLGLVQPATDVALGYGAELEAVAREAGVPVHLERVPSCDHTFFGAMPTAARAVAAWIDATLGLDPRRRPAAARPAGAPDAGVRHRIVTIPGADGTRHDALMHEDPAATDRRAARTARRTAVIHVHGNQGNFSVGALRFLGDPLAAHGLPLLSLETRLSNVSQLFGGALFEEALADLEAGVAWLAREGYGTVVVSGYSLGAVLATRFAARLPPPVLRGLVTVGNTWSLPGSTRRKMTANGASPGYDDLAARCSTALDAGEDPVVVARRAYAADDEPRHAGVYTASTWWHSRGPAAADAETHRHIVGVRSPVLLVQGDADLVVDPVEAGRLAEAARGAGNPDVTVAMLAGAPHSAAGHEEELTGAVVRWLERIA